MDLTEATNQAAALRANGRLAEAIQAYAKIAAAFPRSAATQHNWASALGDAGRWSEAEPKLRQALALGLEAPETRLVLARCLMSLGRTDESEACYVELLARAPAHPLAHRELAQLRWMRGEKIGGALRTLDAELSRAPSAALTMIKVGALGDANEHGQALTLLLSRLEGLPRELTFLCAAVRSAIACDDAVLALSLSGRAIQILPLTPAALEVHVEALLFSGEAAEAARAAEALSQAQPLNQFAIALKATAWRTIGDPRYRALYDYDALVRVEQLDVPPGWLSLDAYLADLAEALNAAHHFDQHPFGQSIKFGGQAANINVLPHPSTQALSQALDAPIRRAISTFGAGADPVRARVAPNYRFEGMWSIRMRAGGWHIDHVHPSGWLSSACYIETPEGVATQRPEGWIKFGEPGVKTAQRLGPEYYVEPRPGRLVLFPSYMWHGTVPFTGGGQRLTFAFDLLPA